MLYTQSVSLDKGTVCHEFGHSLTVYAQRQRLFIKAKARTINFEPVHEISNNVVCATSKASGQPAHTRSLIIAFASRLSIL